MYADWKRKTKVEILNNTSKKCNFVLQQFHILRSFLSASRFRPTWGLSLAVKHIWKDCISITSNNICCWLNAKIFFLCCSMFHGSVHAFWFLEMSATFLHPLIFPSWLWRQSVKRWMPSIFSFHCTRIFCEGRKFEESCSISPTHLSTSSEPSF